MSLRLNPDSTRRVYLGQKIWVALLESQTVSEVYGRLINQSQAVNQYYRAVGRLVAGEEEYYDPQKTSSWLTEGYINSYGTMQLSSLSSLKRQDLEEEARIMTLQTIDQTLVGDTLKLLAGKTDDLRLNFQL